MKSYIAIIGGLLSAISVFLPINTYLGDRFSPSYSYSLMDKNTANAAYFYICCGIVITIVGFINKQQFNIISFLLGVVIAFMSLKYLGDISYDNSINGDGRLGIGLWIMFSGGMLAMIGSFTERKHKIGFIIALFVVALLLYASFR